MKFARKPLQSLGLSPIEVLETILRLNPHIKEVQLWKYSYRPQSFDEGRMHKIWLTRQVCQRSIDRVASTLVNDEQLAICSRVRLSNGAFAHIPMMDYSIPKGANELKLIVKRTEDLNLELAGFWRWTELPLLWLQPRFASKMVRTDGMLAADERSWER